MNHTDWYRERNSRSLRYADRVLNAHQHVLVRAERGYAERYDGQVAILTAVNLLGRMSPAVALDLPDVMLTAPLPWEGRRLPSVALDILKAADPHGLFVQRAERDDDYVFFLGTDGASRVVHGTGWDAFVGRAPSRLVSIDDCNPIGAALAAICGVARLFVAGFQVDTATVLLNAWTWQAAVAGEAAPRIRGMPSLGNIWTVGVGSVGTAVLYFLTLLTRDLSPLLIDMDKVAVHNLDRSPIFQAIDVGAPKVDAVARYLRSVGVATVTAECCALDVSTNWRTRPIGVPDVLVSAANERNVRHTIEASYPPIQIYGTTGRNWQASVIRHVPVLDPCSCCLFPETSFAPTACASAEIAVDPAVRVDAALPFLSFAAGAMAAAEILKLTTGEESVGANRVQLSTNPDIRLVSAPLVRHNGCHCVSRNPTTHRKVIAGSRFDRAHESLTA